MSSSDWGLSLSLGFVLSVAPLLVVVVLAFLLELLPSTAPGILPTTQTVRTSWGSAVSGSLSTMFSRGALKMIPFASVARAVGVVVGRTTRIGPARSLGVCAVIHESSSSGGAVVRVFDDGWEKAGASESSSLRFLEDFFGLSPLNVKGLTMMLLFWL